MLKTNIYGIFSFTVIFDVVRTEYNKRREKMKDNKDAEQNNNAIDEIKKDIKSLKFFTIVSSVSTVLIALLWLIYFIVIQY